MNGQTTKYEAYLKSVEQMKEPEVKRAKIDMRGALAYAKARGIRVSELSQNEKDMFITQLAKAQ